MTASGLIIPPLDDSPPGNPTLLRGRTTPRNAALAEREGLSRTITGTPVVKATDVLAFFERNEGLGERTGNNDNWLTDWWGLHDAWCAMTCSRGLIEAGFRTDDSYSTMLMPGIRRTQTKGWQYVPAMARCFDDAGWFGDTPRQGAMAIAIWSDWTWRDATWRMPGDHVCCVEMVLDGGGNQIPWDDNGAPTDPAAVVSVVTWDGNISNRIGRNHRSASTYFGYGYPPYAWFGPEGDDMFDTPDREKVTAAADILHRIAVGASDNGDAYSGAEWLGRYFNEQDRRIQALEERSQFANDVLARLVGPFGKPGDAYDGAEGLARALRALSTGGVDIDYAKLAAALLDGIAARRPAA